MKGINHVTTEWVGEIWRIFTISVSKLKKCCVITVVDVLRLIISYVVALFA
jgi:hypothetical protein